MQGMLVRALPARPAMEEMCGAKMGGERGVENMPFFSLRTVSISP